MGFPGSLVRKESVCSAGDLDWIPGLGRSPQEGNGNSLQYYCLENPTDRGAWWATVHGVTRIRHNLVTKPPQYPKYFGREILYLQCSLGSTFFFFFLKGDTGSMLGSGRSLEGENGIPFKYCCLENPMDRGAWQAIVYGVAKSGTQLSMHAHVFSIQNA